jgi:hypothetical protein
MNTTTTRLHTGRDGSVLNHLTNVVGEGAIPAGVGFHSLTAAHQGSLTLSGAPELCAAQADAPGRTVEGIVVPYGPVGYTSMGPVTVKAGSLRLPADLASIKLVDEHQTPPRPIGHATAAEDRPEGLWMRFKLGTTALAENALTEALERLRDAFSVELSDITHTGTAVPEITSGYLPSVALVTVPAFGTARVSSVAASLSAAAPTTTTTERPDMTDDQRARLAALRAQDTITPEEAAELATLAIAEHTADQAPTEEPPAEASAPVQVAASHVAPRPATVPAGLSHGTQVRASARPVSELFAAQARVFGGTSRPELEAALSNITSTANIWTSDDAYAGELWSGVAYQRRYVGLMGTAPLTSRKVEGWRWVIKPQVDDYAGDKTAVPSNAPTTEAVTVTAARLAGAHDIDRAEVDFGNTEFIASYYRAMTESYAVKSDRKARAALVAAGAANVSATAATGLWDALLIARLELSTYEDDDFMAGEPDYYLVNPVDLRAVLGTTSANAPAYLGDLGISVDKLIATTAVTAKSVVAGVKNAQTFYELGSSPIRVETINIANGGVDGGVFGYWANLRHHDKGTVRVNWV